VGLGLLEQADGFVDVGDVGLDGDGVAAHGLDVSDDFFGGVGAVGVVDNNVGATTGELDRFEPLSVTNGGAMVVAAAGTHGTAVTVCGSMGGEPLYTMLLLGLGVRSLSMPPHQLPEIKRVIRAIHLEQASAIAAEALRQDTAEAVSMRLHAALS